MKSDINEMNPDIYINDNSPLHIESGSQLIEDFDNKSKISRSKERQASQ